MAGVNDISSTDSSDSLSDTILAPPNDSSSSSVKHKTKRAKPVSKITAENRVKQFPDDLYCDDGILFCKFCCHSIDIVRVNTIKDHLCSKTHIHKKKASKEKGNIIIRQSTLTKGGTLSKELRDGFIIDFVKLSTTADIPLEKV